MADMQTALLAAFDLVDRRENAAALKMVTELLTELPPPNRVTDLPPAKATVYDWLRLAQRSLQGDDEVLVTPKIALRSALALVH